MPEQQKLQKRFCNELEAADFLAVSVGTLQDWRLHKTGPAYHKFGRAVRYARVELERYAEACRVPTAA
jgi:Helix-turn-helix domain